MGYPDKIEYVFTTDVISNTNISVPFWEVVSMKKLLDSMNISYTLEKKIIYGDKTKTVLVDKKNPFQIKKGDVVSIYGTGGKTSVLYGLAALLKEDSVLCTTTEKMYYPKKHQADYEIYDEIPEVKKGITFYANRRDEEKCQSPQLDVLEENIHKFDYVLIESEGSNRKLLKCYDEKPIFAKSTNKGIQVCSLNCIGETINEEHVHLLPGFIKRLGVATDDLLSISLFAKYLSDIERTIQRKDFKRYLFFNQIETYEQYQLMLKVIELLDRDIRSQLNIWFGSAHLNVYESLDAIYDCDTQIINEKHFDYMIGNKQLGI